MTVLSSPALGFTDGRVFGGWGERTGFVVFAWFCGGLPVLGVVEATVTLPGSSSLLLVSTALRSFVLELEFAFESEANTVSDAGDGEIAGEGAGDGEGNTCAVL